MPCFDGFLFGVFGGRLLFVAFAVRVDVQELVVLGAVDVLLGVAVDS